MYNILNNSPVIKFNSGAMNHKELEVWKKSMMLAELIYAISKDFPNTESYGMTSQIRRSAVSIPSNIAEGAGRKSDKEFLYHLNISLGSLAELETQYLLSVRLGFIAESNEILNYLNTVKRLLLGTRNYLINKSN